MGLGDLTFYRYTLDNYAGLLRQIRREFEQVARRSTTKKNACRKVGTTISTPPSKR